MRGSGKSTLTRYLLNRIPKKIRFKIYDLERVHRWKPKDPKKHLIIHPKKGKWLTDFEELLTLTWNEGNTILIVEAIDRLQTVYKMPPTLDDIINVGRNRGISLWITFRRPAKVHKDLIGNADHHFIFRIFDESSVRYYRFATGSDAIYYAKDLQPYHFIYWRVGSKPSFFQPVPKMSMRS